MDDCFCSSWMQNLHLDFKSEHKAHVKRPVKMCIFVAHGPVKRKLVPIRLPYGLCYHLLEPRHVGRYDIIRRVDWQMWFIDCMCCISVFVLLLKPAGPGWDQQSHFSCALDRTHVSPVQRQGLHVLWSQNLICRFIHGHGYVSLFFETIDFRTNSIKSDKADVGRWFGWIYGSNTGFLLLLK